MMRSTSCPPERYEACLPLGTSRSSMTPVFDHPPYSRIRARCSDGPRASADAAHQTAPASPCRVPSRQMSRTLNSPQPPDRRIDPLGRVFESWRSLVLENQNRERQTPDRRVTRSSGQYLLGSKTSPSSPASRMAPGETRLMISQGVGVADTCHSSLLPGRGVVTTRDFRHRTDRRPAWSVRDVMRLSVPTTYASSVSVRSSCFYSGKGIGIDRVYW